MAVESSAPLWGLAGWVVVASYDVAADSLDIDAEAACEFLLGHTFDDVLVAYLGSG